MEYEAGYCQVYDKMTRLMTRFIEYSGYDFVNWILWNDEIQLGTQQRYEIPNFVGEFKAVLLIRIGSRHMGGEGMLKFVYRFNERELS